jgi:hypothetical protein
VESRAYFTPHFGGMRFGVLLHVSHRDSLVTACVSRGHIILLRYQVQAAIPWQSTGSVPSFGSALLPTRPSKTNILRAPRTRREVVATRDFFPYKHRPSSMAAANGTLIITNGSHKQKETLPYDAPCACPRPLRGLRRLPTPR